MLKYFFLFFSSGVEFENEALVPFKNVHQLILQS